MGSAIASHAFVFVGLLSVVFTPHKGVTGTSAGAIELAEIDASGRGRGSDRDSAGSAT